MSSSWSDGCCGIASSTCIIPNHNLWVCPFHPPSIEKCAPCRQYPRSPHKNAVPFFQPCVAITHTTAGPTSSFSNGRVFHRREIDQGVVSLARATHYCGTLTYVIPEDRELTELDDRLLIQLSMQTNKPKLCMRVKIAKGYSFYLADFNVYAYVRHRLWIVWFHVLEAWLNYCWGRHERGCEYVGGSWHNLRYLLRYVGVNSSLQLLV